MKPANQIARAVIIVASAIFYVSGIAMAQNSKKIDPCTLLTRAEIQTAIGQTIGEGKLSPSANPATGAPCQYTVGTGGVFGILCKIAGPGETASNVMAGLKKIKIPVVDVPGIGDHSFFSSPGYGMVQLNTFKGSNYLIMTMLVPGASEAAQKAAAKDLMRKALEKI